MSKKINEPFRLENARNLTNEFFMQILTKSLLNYCLVKIDIQKTRVSNFVHFKNKMVRFFFLQKEAIRSESVKYRNLLAIISPFLTKKFDI